MRTSIAVAACVMGFVGVCQAGQIASAPIYAGFTQHVAFCLVYNGGTTTQHVTPAIFDENGTAQTGVNTSCLDPLLPGEYCAIAKINISNNVAYACAVTAGNVTNLRGTMILQNSSDTSLRTTPLR